MTWVKPPLTTAVSYPSRFNVRTNVRAPGERRSDWRTWSRSASVSPASKRTR